MNNLMVFVFTELFVFLVRTVCLQIKNTLCTACEAECEIPIFEHQIEVFHQNTSRSCV